MFASVPINTPLLCTLKERWILAWLEGDTLGEVLSTVRGDWGRRTPGYLSQLKMAAQLAKIHGEYAPSQGTISNIENDLKSIMDLQPEVRLDLLKLYPLKDSQIKEIDERFTLKLPLPHKMDYLNNSGTSTSNSAIVWITEVGGEEGGSYPMYRETLEREGVSQEDCKAFAVDDDVLMQEQLREMIPDETVLFCTPKVAPKPNNLLGYRCRESGRKVLLQHNPRGNKVPIMSADGSHADFVSESDERLEFVGVSIARFTGGR